MTVDPQLLTGLGAALAIFLTSYGSAIASSHSGIFAVRGSDLRAFIPIVISGVLAIYGIIVAVLLVGKLNHPEDGTMTAVDGYRNLSAGLAVGLACAASGMGLANFIQQINNPFPPPFPHPPHPRPDGPPESEPLVGGRRPFPPHPPVNFVHLCLSLVFLEAIGLYGLIVALFLLW